MNRTATFVSPVVFAFALLILSACGNDTLSSTESASVTLPPATVATPPTTQPAPATTSTPATSTPASDEAPASTAAPAPTTSTTAPPATTTPPGPTRISLRLVGSYDEPLDAIARQGDPLFYLLERDGRVVPIDPATGTANRAILDISSEVTTNAERGLLGGTFSPDGSALYLHYSDRSGDTQLHRWSVDASGRVDANSRTPLFSLEQPFGNHNGGQVAFGPDGLLYLGLGDGGAADDPLNSGQDTSTALGSILRFDPSGGDPYIIPADNPFADGGGVPEIFLWGIRNAWRFSFDSATGDLWIGDVGQNAIEEITVLRAADGGGVGANLGWRLREGNQAFAGAEPSGHVGPIHEYGHAGGNCSVTGGYVYRGDAIPALNGTYVYADYCVGELVTVDQSGTATPLGLVVDGRNVVSFAEDADGELYVISQTGQLFELVVVEG